MQIAALNAVSLCLDSKRDKEVTGKSGNIASFLSDTATWCQCGVVCWCRYWISAPSFWPISASPTSWPVKMKRLLFFYFIYLTWCYVPTPFEVGTAQLSFAQCAFPVS